MTKITELQPSDYSCLTLLSWESGGGAQPAQQISDELH